MKPALCIWGGLCFALIALIDLVQPLCVLESDFGFKINCAFKKSGLFRVRNLGGIKAHASLGFSLGDELGFEQSLTNLDPSRRRSVSFKNGAPNVIVDTSNRSTAKQEKRGKQNRIMMRPMPSPARPNQSAMDKLSSLHRRVSSTMQPIIVPSVSTLTRPAITLAKPMPMGVPPFRPLPPKEDTLKVLPITKNYQSHQQNGNIAFSNSVPHQVHQLASNPISKADDYNTITGYGDDTALKYTKDDINEKIAEIAKAGNISAEAVEAAIALRQQQLLTKYANIPMPVTPVTTTTTTEPPVVFQQPEPDIVVESVQKPKRNPTVGKVMNAPREYYPIGYEKNFDDHFQSKVELPDTSFHCGDQKYFPGLYGDENLGCMVFHVCALTDDGLVMKSFLCPESTLFDQAILKCNWWFYVDCKSTTKLYDTNIPVSKSYQLMKALTFFSSYKKEMQEGNPVQPEEVEGIKDAINILENQDSSTAQSNINGGLHIITPQPIIVDERNNRQQYTTESPVYRGQREYRGNNSQAYIPPAKNSDTTPRGFNLTSKGTNTPTNVTAEVAAETSNKTDDQKLPNNSSSTEKRHRRRMTLNSRHELTTFSSPLVDIMKKEIQPFEEKKETLTDQIDVHTEGSLSPSRRVYRSSGEREREIEVVNDERIHIVRPVNVPGSLRIPNGT